MDQVKPVVVGPHIYNFADAVRLAVAAGAALQVGNVDEAVTVARELLADTLRYQRMAEAGRNFVRAHAGATQRVVGMISVAR